MAGFVTLAALRIELTADAIAGTLTVGVPAVGTFGTAGRAGAPTAGTFGVVGAPVDGAPVDGAPTAGKVAPVEAKEFARILRAPLTALFNPLTVSFAVAPAFCAAPTKPATGVMKG
jgi:hypothetical protein